MNYEYDMDEAIIHIKGPNINEFFSKKYRHISEVYRILNFFKKLETSFKKIDMIHVTFIVLNEYLNIKKVNKLSSAIISSKLFVSFCNYHKSRVLVYDELQDFKKKINIIISNKETFKNADCHIFIHNREHYYNERLFLADP